MTIAQTRQTIREWIAGIVQGKQAPAEKLAELEQRQRDKAAELQRVLATSEQAILERELSEIEAARVAMLPAVKAAVIAAYEQQVREWEAEQEKHREENAVAFLADQERLDRWAAHCATRPRPPAGAPPDYWSNDREIFDARNGLINAAEALHGKFDRAGTGDAPRMVRRVPSTQVWGVPAGRKQGG